MTHASYNQFCPVAMAAELLCTRWTVIVLRELLAGSRRFNDLRRGVPRMSPALLSQRLKELEAGGIVRRAPVDGAPGLFEYHLTEAGRDLAPIVESFGMWGQRWVKSEVSLQYLDAHLLMWDMRRNLDPKPMPERRSVIQFLYPEQPPADRRWWLIVAPQQDTDICGVDPGFDVDLYVATDLRTMTAIWMGAETTASAQDADKMVLTGDRDLARNIQTWLGLSPFARTARPAAGNPLPLGERVG